MYDFTVGLDVEGFIMHRGQFYPATGLIGGNKKSPRRIECGALQEDNVMFEINVDPSNDPATLRKNIDTVVAQLNDCVQSRLGKKAKCLFIPHAEFNPDVLYSSPNFGEFGCDADFDAYSGVQYQYPDFAEGTTRWAGGHLHIGHPVLTHPGVNADMVKYLDEMILSFYMDLHPEELKSSRIKHYGRAGNYRNKTYGLEYRSLPPGWIFDDSFISIAYDYIDTAIRDLLNDRNLSDMYLLRGTVRDRLIALGGN